MSDEIQFDIENFYKIYDPVIAEYKRILSDQGHYATGELIDKTTSIIEYDGRYLKLGIDAPLHWKYVEYGRKPGKMPPIDEILKWVKIKGLPRSNSSMPGAKSGKLPTERQLSFLIARKIGKVGIKPSNALQDAFKNSEIEEKIINEIHMLIIDYLTKKTEEILSTI